MLEKILLDTNMLIYLEDDHVLDTNVARLTRILYDSFDYKIVIHPKSINEANKIKDEKRKSIFLSKISVYKQINNPPNAPKEFHDLVGYKNDNDKIDNELLFAIKQNCVSYFITNDINLQKKSQKVGLKDRVFSIEEAIEKFKIQEKRNIITPIFIKEEYLYQLQLENSFFDSLREDYKKFDNWFKDKQMKSKKAFITKNNKDEVTSFLMLKIEDEKEKYEEFEKPFKPAKRLKVSTFKVGDSGKRIGETFIKLIIEMARKEKTEEIYITIFPKYNFLIDLFKEYGFEYYTYKNTENAKGQINKEYILVKDMKNKNYYPFVKLDNQGIFIIPIKPPYHKLLFPEAVKEVQLKITDYDGIDAASNAIKKAYISNSKIKRIKSGDILLFYASEDRKAITSLGIVNDTFSKFDNIEEITNLVRKRTAYDDNELRKVSNTNSLVIMFKHYMCFSKDVSFKYLIKNGIVNGYIRCPIEITKGNFINIINKNKEDKKFFEIKM